MDLKYFKQIALIFIIGLYSTPSLLAQCNVSIQIISGTQEGCGYPHVVQFSSNVDCAVQDILWDFGDGSTSTADNPTHEFYPASSGDKIYNVTVSINCLNGNNCTDQIPITVYYVPNVDFSFSSDSACQLTESVCFTNLSDTNLIDFVYTWTFPATTSNDFEPCHIFQNDSVNNVRLNVTTSQGCFKERDTSLFIISQPNPEFTVSQQIGCYPLPVQVNNVTDTSSIASWQWNFDDGTVVNDYNAPIHEYDTTGLYMLSLQAISNQGCTGTTTKAIEVKQTPSAQISNQEEVCLNVNTTIAFDTLTYPGNHYEWFFEDGIPQNQTGVGPFQVQWDSSGTKLIRVLVELDGCSAIDTTTLFVIPQPVVYLNATATNNVICEGDQVTFTASPADYTAYDFTVNGTSVNPSYITGNKFTTRDLNDGDVIFVDAYDDNGCPSAIIGDSIRMTVKPRPVVSISTASGSDSICNGDTVVFIADPAIYDNYCFFNGFKPLGCDTLNYINYTDSLEGKPIKAMATWNGCKSDTSNITSYFEPIIFNPPDTPVVNCGTTTINSIEIIWDTVLHASSYEFSIDGGLNWYAPNGDYSHVMDTAINPGDTVCFQVQALGQGPCGESPLAIEPACCIANPCTGFDYSKSNNRTICEGEFTTLEINNITIPNYKVYWDTDSIGNNNTTYQISPTDTRDYWVKVQNLDEIGCPMVQKKITVTVVPTPEFSIYSSLPSDSICAGTCVSFTVDTAGLDEYQFFINYNLEQTGPLHVFENCNIENGDIISAIVTNNGCSAFSSTEDSTKIIVFPELNTPQVNCGQTSISSIEFVWDSIPGATGYLISVDGGTFITPDNSFSHDSLGLAQGQALSAIVQALGNSPCGNSTYSLPATCYAEECDAIDFGKISNIHLCQGEDIMLYINNITIPNYTVSWNNLAPSADTTFFYSPSGTETIPVTVYNENQPGCVPTTKYININVNAVPPLSLSSTAINDSICNTDIICFQASPGGYDNYQFYDNFNLRQNTANHQFCTDSINDGHDIMVIGTNDGCSNIAELPVSVSVVSPVSPPQVNCGNSTTNSIDFLWDSLPGITKYIITEINSNPINDTVHNPLYTLTPYPPNDSAQISVVAISNGPCGNSQPSTVWDTTVTCYTKPCTAITFDMPLYDSVCMGNDANIQLNNLSATNYQITWMSDLDTITNSSNSYSYTPHSDDTVTIIITDLDQPGCPSAIKNMRIYTIPLPEATINFVSNDSICSGDSVALSASPAGWDSYSYYANGSMIQDSLYPNCTINSVTQNTGYYVQSHYLGCTYTTDTLNLTAVQAPDISIISNSNLDSICESLDLVFTIQPADYVDYYFYDSDSLVQDSTTNTYTIQNISVADSIHVDSITAFAVNYFGCNSNVADTVQITILPQTNITLSVSDTLICYGDQVTYSVQPTDLVNYRFYNMDSLVQTSANENYTTSDLDFINAVTAIGTNSLGCDSEPADTIEVHVKPLAYPTITSNDDTICIGDTTNLIVSTDNIYPNVQYVWSTGENTEEIFVTPSSTQSYSVYSIYNQCQSPDSSYQIFVDTNIPTAFAGYDTTICIDSNAYMHASGGVSYEWMPADSFNNPYIANPVLIQPQINGIYYVVATNIACKDTSNVNVFIDLCINRLGKNPPDVITPDPPDGIGDEFLIPEAWYFENNQLFIYNRWGNIVYQKQHYQGNEWHGQSTDGKRLVDGTYYYIFDLGNGTEPYVGYVVIVR